MKLSMYMIEEWLKEFSPVANIVDGSRTIVNARLFTDDLPESEDCLHVGRNADFFPESSSMEVLIMYRKDIISLKSDELNRIFNQILYAFDYYNKMEEGMFLASVQPEPEQRILDICASRLGPTFLMTKDYHILAVSRNYSDIYVNEFWESFVENREPSISMIQKMKESEVNRLMKRENHMVFFREPNAYPYQYGIMNSYFQADGRMIGALVTASTSPITNFEADLVEILMAALNLAQKRAARPEKFEENISNGNQLFFNLLSGIEEERSADYLKVLGDFDQRTHFYLAVLEMEDSFLHWHRIETMIGRWTARFLCTHYQRRLLLLFHGPSRESLSDTVHQVLDKLAEELSIRAGISNYFRDVMHCKYYLVQAEYAIKGRDAVNDFKDYAVEYLLREQDSVTRTFAKHPIVFCLEELNTAERIDYRNTLKAYLMCERSIKRAAAVLYVHRNTVLYRMERIRSLHCMDLENDEERLYVLLSLI